MDVPGVSIIAGVGSLHLNSSAQDRLDEQEDFEDEERRNKELAANLDAAFDDLADDEPSSLNSSHDLEATHLHNKSRLPTGNETPGTRNPPTYIESLHHLKDPSYKLSPLDGPASRKDFGCLSEASDDPRVRYSPCGAGDGENMLYNELRGYHIGQHNGVNSYGNKQEMIQELKVMNEMRLKECEQLAKKLADREEEIDCLRERLSRTNKEKGEVTLHHEKTQRELAKLRQQLVASENESDGQRARAEQASADTDRVKRELQQVKKQLNLHALERERYETEFQRLTDDFERLKSKLSEKDEELLTLTSRCASAERLRDETAAEKSSVAEQLRRELDTTHRSNLQMKELGKKLQQTAQDLVSNREECAQLRRENDEWRNIFQTMMKDIASDNVYANMSLSPTKISTVKELLISRYNEKIQNLQQEINNREAQLESSRLMEKELRRDLQQKRTNENELISRVSSLNRQIENLQKSCTQLECENKELKTSRRSLDRPDGDLLRELEKMTAHNKDLLKENSKLKSLYLEVCIARDALSREIQEVRAKLNQAQTEMENLWEREKSLTQQLERERKEVDELKRGSETAREQLDEANRKVEEQQIEYTIKQKELADKLYKYIKKETVTSTKENESCNQCELRARMIAQLETQIKQCYKKIESQECIELLINELKSKAEYFEQYIIDKFLKIQEQRHVSTNTEPVTNGLVGEPEEKYDQKQNSKQIIDQDEHDKHENREDETEEDLSSSTDLMMKEKNIREQLAEKYTLEIKTIEMGYNKKMSELQKEATTNISTLKELLETKAREIEVLKKFIIAERAKVTEILQAKESDISSLNSEKRKLQEEFRELRDKANEMEQLLEKSHAKNVKLKADLEKLTEEMTRQKERSSKSMSEMGEQLRQLESKTTSIQTQHEQLRDKYRSVKKTALVYKEYAAKKDAHVESELERIKKQYEAEVERLNDKLQRLIKKSREIQVNEKISKMQSEFDALVSEVNSAT